MPEKRDIVERLRAAASNSVPDIPDELHDCGLTVAEAKELLAEIERLRERIAELEAVVADECWMDHNQRAETRDAEIARLRDEDRVKRILDEVTG